MYVFITLMTGKAKYSCLRFPTSQQLLLVGETCAARAAKLGNTLANTGQRSISYASGTVLKMSLPGALRQFDIENCDGCDFFEGGLTQEPEIGLIRWARPLQNSKNQSAQQPQIGLIC